MTGTRIGSVCTGYGGLDMAVQAVLGGHLAWVADPDPGPVAILAHHHPDVPNLGDITALDWHQVPPVDVLCGGYPCQPFSVAGQLKGTADDRHLWPYIADALRVLRPRLAIFENVANHLRLGFDVVLADLAEIGFDAEWSLVRASDVGGAHQRERLFILAWPADAGRPRLAWGWAGRAVADRRHDPADTDSHPVRQQPVIEPRRNGTPVAGLPDSRAHSDTHGRRLPEFKERHGQPEESQADDERRQPHPVGCGVPDADAKSERRPEGGAEPEGQQRRLDVAERGSTDWGRYAPAIHRWEAVLGRPAPAPVNDRGRLDPPFVEWLMGLAGGHVTAVPGLSRTAQLKALGNGVVPLQAVTALRFLLDRATRTAEPRT